MPLLDEIEDMGCHLVPKQPKNYFHRDRDYLWRISCSVAEKKIMNDGDSGNSNSCRHRTLQILKTVISEDAILSALASYHMKTLILWESERYPDTEDWNETMLSARFLSAVRRILGYLNRKMCPHYFLGSVNLFENFSTLDYEQLLERFQYIICHPREYFENC